ncbi:MULTISPECIES: hypothetical protein [unclassified Microbacterium]|uniref:hypothetical protein n=1 Tax=unclassified Microbacterium TaxID=2609290 RepID=UPI003745CBBD
MFLEPFTLLLILWVDLGLLAVVLILLLIFYVIRPRVMRDRTRDTQPQQPLDA